MASPMPDAAPVTTKARKLTSPLSFSASPRAVTESQSRLRFSRFCVCSAEVNTPTAPASLIARWVSIGAARLPDRSANRPNTQPAAPVATTVRTTGSPVARASGMCDKPNATAWTSRPIRGPNASAASVASAPR